MLDRDSERDVDDEELAGLGAGLGLRAGSRGNLVPLGEDVLLAARCSRASEEVVVAADVVVLVAVAAAAAAAAAVLPQMW